MSPAGRKLAHVMHSSGSPRCDCILVELQELWRDSGFVVKDFDIKGLFQLDPAAGIRV